MYSKIKIQPGNIKLFSCEILGDCPFYLITNPALAHHFELFFSPKYKSGEIILLDQPHSIDAILQTLPGYAHILVISPLHFSEINDAHIKEKQKIIVMSCFETFANLEAINCFINNLELSDPEEQQQFSDYFFKMGTETKKLIFIDPDYETYAEFQHLSDDYTWHELAGVLPDQSQYRDCGGEIAVTPTHFNLSSRIEDQRCLDITGSILLKGYPVLQNTRQISSIQDDQQRIYNKLSTLAQGAVRLEVEKGIVTHLSALDEAAKPALNILNALFEIDSRHRIIYEIGFGFNKKSRLFPGNIGFNESFGGTDGIVHFGFGSRLTTQYHLDVLCPNTSVLNDQNQLFFGNQVALQLS